MQYSVWWWCYYLGFSLCISTPAPLFLRPLVAAFLSFMSSLTLTTHQAGYWKPVFNFPESDTIPQVCAFSLAHRLGPVFCCAPLFFGALYHAPHMEAHTGIGLRVGGGVGLALCMLGAWGSRREIPGCGTPKGSWAGLLLSSLLCPLKFLFASFPISFLPPSLTSVLCVLLEENEFHQLHPTKLGKPVTLLTVLLFPWGRNHCSQINQPHAVYLWWGEHFFSSNDMLESPLRKDGLLQILSCEWKSVQFSISRFLPKHGERNLGRFAVFWLCRFQSLYQGLSAYYQMHRWVRLLLGPLVYGARSYNSFIHG